MSVAGSTSSRGTHSRSRSRSRSPPYNDGRYMPPRYSSRYDSYSYRPRSAMSNAIDDYRELRERDRDRDRDRGRDRLSLNMRDDRYLSRGRDRDNRYPPRYYRDDLPPPHHYPPSSSIPREYPKSSSSGPVRRDTSNERIKDTKNVTPTNFNKDAKDDTRMGNNGPDSYTPPPRYNDWHRDRDRDRDRERDRRYRDDWRDMDMRSRDRDSYMMRYDNSGYGPPPPPLAPPSLSMSYAPFGGDSYRPDRDRDRDMPPSPGGPHLPYYDRDRMDDRDFYRHIPRNAPMDSDRYRGRPARSWGPSSSPAPSTMTPIKGGRERDRDREGSIKSPRSASSASGVPPWAPVLPSSTATTPTTAQRSGAGKDDTKSDDMERSSGFEESESTMTPKRGNTPERRENDRPDLDQISTTTTGDRPSPPPSSTASEIAEPIKADIESKSFIKEDTRPVDEKDVKEKEHEEIRVKREEEEPVITTTTISHAENLSVSASSDTQPQEQQPSEQQEKKVSEDAVAQSPKIENDKPINNVADSNNDGVPVSMNESSQVLQPSPTTISTTTTSDEIPVEKSVGLDMNVPKTESTSNDNMVIEVKPQSTAVVPATVEDTATVAVTSTEEAASESDAEKQMTQQEIVERIDQIENDITMYEEMLEQMNKQEEEEENKKDNTHNEEGDEISSTTDATAAAEAEQEQKEREEEEAAKQQALQVISEETSRSQPMADIENLSSLKASPVMRKRPQLLINQVRSNDETDDLLSEKLMAENRKIAKENSKMIGGWQGKPDTAQDWSDEEEWSKPLYKSIEDYPCYKENVGNFDKIKVSITHSIADHNKKMKKKELRLKKEYRERYEDWKQRNLSLDRIRDHERRASEKYTYRSTSQSRRRMEEDNDELIDGVVFNGDSDALRFGTDGGNTYGGPAQNAWTSDAARSEAELLEIIQSLESADMRNPELRAAKTTATIPPMILDEKERMRTYDDRSGLVMDPLTYYHTGPDTEDHWTQQEMTAFMESYMQYPKQFEKIAAAVKTKTAPQCVLFYYRKKTKIDFKALVSKGRRGKGSKRRDRLAQAIRRATGASTTRKGKSKGSALMTDIGEAQVSRNKAKQKETERKSRELRELEEANAYWDGVHERRRTKRPGPTPSASAPTSSTSQAAATAGGVSSSTAGATSGTPFGSSTVTGEELDKSRGDKRRLPRRSKGRSPRSSVGVAQVVPIETTISTPTSNANAESMDEIDGSERNLSTTAKWADEDKKVAIEAFKAHGRNFTRVAALVGTKTEDQCRNYYHNYKRKYGPNAFNEEPESTPAPQQQPSASVAPTSSTASTPPAISTKPAATAIPASASMSGETAIHEIAGARLDLKAEEEDAAAALMGMCRMGATTPPANLPKTTPSTSTSGGHTRTLSTQMENEKTKSSMGSAASAVQGGQRRRRARTSSGKAVDSEVMEEWMEIEFSSSRPTRRPGRPPGTTMSSDAAKRPAYSSYWTVSEKNELIRCLERFGSDWDKVASVLTSKTATQVRNFYVNNEEKMKLDVVVKRFERSQQQQPSAAAVSVPPSQPQQQALPPAPAPVAPAHHSQEPLPPPSSAYDESSKAHFRVLQNVPFPQPVVAEQPGYASPAMASGSRGGYYTPSPPAPPQATATAVPTAATVSRQHQPPPGVMHTYHGGPPPAPHQQQPPMPPGYSSLHVHPPPPGPQSSPPSRAATVSPYPPSHAPPPSQQQKQQHAHAHPSHPQHASPHPYPHIHTDRSPHPLQPPSPHGAPVPSPHHQHTHQPPPPHHQQQHYHTQSNVSKSASSSVTKVADLLNSDEPSDSSNQNSNWHSWFD